MSSTEGTTSCVSRTCNDREWNLGRGLFIVSGLVAGFNELRRRFAVEVHLRPKYVKRREIQCQIPRGQEIQSCIYSHGRKALASLPRGNVYVSTDARALAAVPHVNVQLFSALATADSHQCGQPRQNECASFAIRICLLLFPREKSIAVSTMAALAPSSPRLPSPPPPAEIQIGPKSPSMGPTASRHAQQMEQSANVANAKRRIHPGTKAVDFAAGPPLVPLNEVCVVAPMAAALRPRTSQLTQPSLLRIARLGFPASGAPRSAPLLPHGQWHRAHQPRVGHDAGGTPAGDGQDAMAV